MLRLYDTLTRQIREVEPIWPGTVKMYTCGPTVYRDAHIGNLRSYLMADWIRRALEYQGLTVSAIKNITDVGHMRQEELERGEDKVVAAALAEGKTPGQIADFYTERFLNDETKLNIETAALFPKATDHITEMVQITERLLEKGHAYVAEGNVYFSVSSLPTYGALSGNRDDGQLLEALRIEVDPLKQDPRDFTLWKAAEPGRDLKWPSPWGDGFPGWHIECSAMSIKYLGERFDIHTGGVDNIFPHHEGEIAQSEGFTGKTVVNTWVHGQHLLADGVKMAKSMGNSFTLAEIEAKQIDPMAFRYLCLTVKYRSRLNFTFASLKAAQRALARLRLRVWEWGLATNGTHSAGIPESGAGPEEPEVSEEGTPDDMGADDGDGDVGAVSAESELDTSASEATSDEAVDDLPDADAEEEARPAAVPAPASDLEGPSDSDEERDEWVGRFLDRVNDNLDMPGAIALTWELARSEVPDSTKLQVIHEFDKVLGLELRTVADAFAVPGSVMDLAGQRTLLRTKGNFKKADEMRAQLDAEGYVTNDTRNGALVRPKTAWEKREEAMLTVSSPSEVTSFVEDLDTVDFTVGIVASNYTEDVSRCVQSALWWGRDRKVQVVVTDNGSTDGTSEWLEETAAKDARVEVVHTDHILGAGAAYNIILKRSRGKTVILIDPSVEVRGDIFGPIDAMLEDEQVGVAGPFGLRSEDLQHFHEGEGEPGDMDAMQAYCFAFRRSRLTEVGLMRESFRFYRNIDIDYSFHFKDKGLRILADPDLPVRRHEHRAWSELAEKDRDELSKKNYGRFLDKWGKRMDLLVSLQAELEPVE